MTRASLRRLRRVGASRGIVLACILFCPAASERIHWHRTDQRPADAAAVAAALAECRRPAAREADRERTLARCMSRQGYYSWDGV